MTKIRPSRLAEIEADDFSQFPSLAYAKGFLLIYGKFLDVDVTPYMEAFEGSDAVTVDGYSYLQDNPAPKPVRTPAVPRRSVAASSSGKPMSLMPVVIAAIVIVVGYSAMRLLLNLQRIVPREPAAVAQASTAAPSSTPHSAIVPPPVAASPPKIVSAVPTPAASQVAHVDADRRCRVAAASPPTTPAAAEPEVRKAEAVRPEDLVKSNTTAVGPNKMAIRSLKKTYIKVVVDNETLTPAFERWISPSDGPVEFQGQHFAVRVLDRDSVQIKKNGKLVAEGDTDVTIE